MWLKPAHLVNRLGLIYFFPVVFPARERDDLLHGVFNDSLSTILMLSSRGLVDFFGGARIHKGDAQAND